MSYRIRKFTLLELLIVIGILAILTGILLPVLLSARERSKASSCVSNLKQLSDYAMQYRNLYANHWCGGDAVGSTRNPAVPYVYAMGIAGIWSSEYKALASKAGDFLRCPSVGFKADPTAHPDAPTMDDWFNFQAYPSICTDDSGSTPNVWHRSLIPFNNEKLRRGGDLNAAPSALIKLAPSNILWFGDGIRPAADPNELRMSPRFLCRYETGKTEYSRPYAVHSGKINVLSSAGNVESVDPETMHKEFYAPTFGPMGNGYGGVYSYKVQTYVSSDDPANIRKLE